MKKLSILLIIALLLCSFSSCGLRGDTGPVILEPSAGEGTMGKALWDSFRNTLSENPEIGMEELANALAADPALPFTGSATTVAVDAEYFVGFDNYRITGFDSAAVYMPMMGSIAFVGYVFDLSEGADASEFIQFLTDNCNPRWNICVEAEQTAAGAVGDKLFFVMCSADIEA